MQEKHGRNLFFKMAYSVRKARIMTKNERLRLINKNHGMSKTDTDHMNGKRNFMREVLKKMAFLMPCVTKQRQVIVNTRQD